MTKRKAVNKHPKNTSKTKIKSFKSKKTTQKSNQTKKLNQIKYTKIQKQIIDYVLNNKSNLSFNFNEIKPTDKLLTIADGIKNSCLAIASDEFGSAVCISENGFILTCAHAAPSVENQISKSNLSLLIFPNGEQVKAKTIEKDENLDLALLKVIEVQQNAKFIKLEKLKDKRFVSAQVKRIDADKNLWNKNADKNEKVFCIGNPSFAEFRNCNSNSYFKNEYMPFWLSKGKIKGYMKDEVYGNCGLGPMIHSCWTYWGHSGAPIFDYNCELVGLHNSWNDENANRHAISLSGIRKFLSKFEYLNIY